VASARQKFLFFLVAEASTHPDLTLGVVVGGVVGFGEVVVGVVVVGGAGATVVLGAGADVVGGVVVGEGAAVVGGGDVGFGAVGFGVPGPGDVGFGDEGLVVGDTTTGFGGDPMSAPTASIRSVDNNPSALMAPMATTTMAPRRRAYSTNVAPRSFR